jgi:hypothetical protein
MLSSFFIHSEKASLRLSYASAPINVLTFSARLVAAGGAVNGMASVSESELESTSLMKVLSWSVTGESLERDILESTDLGGGLTLPSILRFGKSILGESDTGAGNRDLALGPPVLLSVGNVNFRLRLVD